MMPSHGDVFARFPVLAGLRVEFDKVLSALIEVSRSGRLVMVCGNGGSAADAEHIVGEMMKGFLLPRPVPEEFRTNLVKAYGDRGSGLADRLQQGIRAVSLVGHPALATAYGNDMAPDMVFAQQVYALGHTGDALIGLSTSGESRNVIQAFEIAGVMGIKRIAFTGEQGGRLSKLADLCLRAPAKEAYLVQELHLPLYHALCASLEEALYGHAG